MFSAVGIPCLQAGEDVNWGCIQFWRYRPTHADFRPATQTARSKFAIADSSLPGCLPPAAPGREANRPAGYPAQLATKFISWFCPSSCEHFFHSFDDDERLVFSLSRRFAVRMTNTFD